MPFKVFAAVLVAPLSLVLGVPLLTGAAATPPGQHGCIDDPTIERALATIRALESGDRYDLPPGSGGASGAYQYLGSTWRRWASDIDVDLDRYPQAYLAPPAVQDLVAVANVHAILGDTSDLARIPVAWYWPRALTHPEDLDIVPAPGAGNRLTVRAYRDRWLDLYADQPPASTDACNAGTVGDYALPIDRQLIDRDPSMLSRPHHDYPAIDLPVPIGTPVYAVRGGTVHTISNHPGTCSSDACEASCGIGLTIDADDGSRWTYCHGSALHVTLGHTVVAGDLILSSGDSGHSTGPHLHLGVSVDGRARCPQSLLLGLYTDGSTGNLRFLPTAGCTTN
jgi:hypothetical protein